VFNKLLQSITHQINDGGEEAFASIAFVCVSSALNFIMIVQNTVTSTMATVICSHNTTSKLT
jgi:hypothetical protein